MKQKFKDLLKKKNKPTFDEAAAYFTAMTDAQKAAKKGGVTDEAFPIGLESPNFGGNAGLMNASGFEPKLTRTKRWGDINGGWLPEVVIHGKTKKPEDPLTKLIRLNNPNTIRDWADDLSNRYRPKVQTGGINSTLTDKPTDVSSNPALHYSNTQSGNAAAYKTIGQRNDYYKWVDKQVEGKSKWFKAAAEVTSWRAVGAAAPDRFNGPFLNDAAGKLLQAGNKALFPHNMENAKKMMAGTLDQFGYGNYFTDAKGEIIWFAGKKGKDFDYALVRFEQTKVQEFLTQYRMGNPSEEVNSAIESINSSMGMPGSPQNVRDVIKEQFNEERGQKAFDFNSYNDKVKLGQGIIDKLHNR